MAVCVNIRINLLAHSTPFNLCRRMCAPTSSIEIRSSGSPKRIPRKPVQEDVRADFQEHGEKKAGGGGGGKKAGGGFEREGRVRVTGRGGDCNRGRAGTEGGGRVNGGNGGRVRGPVLRAAS